MQFKVGLSDLPHWDGDIWKSLRELKGRSVQTSGEENTRLNEHNAGFLRQEGVRHVGELQGGLCGWGDISKEKHKGEEEMSSWFSNFAGHLNHLRLLVRCRFWFSSSGWGLRFSWCCWSAGPTWSSKLAKIARTLASPWNEMESQWEFWAEWHDLTHIFKGSHWLLLRKITLVGQTEGRENI